MPQETRKPYLALNHVSKSFGKIRVLDDVTFGAVRGQTLCILGRSGVGKSVCLRLMMGFLKPDSGRIIAAGEDVTDYSEEELDRYSQQGHDGVPERRIIRLTYGSRKRSFSIART